MKGKFDFKELMVQRGEFFALGAVVLIVAYLGYDALGYGVLKPGQSPEQLDNDVRAAGGLIDVSPPPPETAVYQADLSHDEIVTKEIQLITFAPDEFAPLKRRGQPTFYNIEDPRACAGVGSFAVTAPAGAKTAAGVEFRPLANDRVLPGFQGGEKAAARAMRWVVVTGDYNLTKQQANFDAQFLGADRPAGRKPEDDVLVFKLDPSDMKPPIIERAEVTSQAGAALAWEQIAAADVIRGLFGEKDWIQTRGGGQAKGGQKMAHDPKFSNPIFTSPLPPLLLEDWTEACVLHAPEIPMLQGDKSNDKQPGKVNEDKPDDNVFGGPKVKQPAVAPKKVAAVANTNQFHLFRFFDYTVQPGKSYVYRVKLYMGNPNFGIDPRFLTADAANITQQVGAFSDNWSPTTQPVTVPIASGVLAGVLTRRMPGDDRAHMMVIDRDAKTGLEGHKEMTRRVGHLAYFPLESDVDSPRLENAWWEDPDVPGVRHPRKRRSNWILVGQVLVLDPLLKKIRVDRTFTSDVALLDVRGGASGQPDEILVMDGQGNLSAHQSGSDAAEFQRRNDLVTAEGAAETDPGGGPDGFKNPPAGGGGFRNKSED